MDDSSNSGPSSAPGLYEHFARHQERVRRLVRSLLRDEHAAEDILQDAWVVAMERPPRLPQKKSESAPEGAQPARAWLGRVAQNLALNSRRSDRRRGDRERRAGEDEARAGSGAALSSDEVVARLELQRRLMRALEALDEPLRTLMRDHYLGEQSLAALARRDGVPESTLRSRIKAGLAALRGRLDAEGFADEDGEPAHWSLALAPLALVPVGAAPIPPSLPPGSAVAVKSPSPAGAALAASASASGTLFSLTGALLMKKAALALVALAVLFLGVQQVLGDGPSVIPDVAEPEQVSPTVDLASPAVDSQGLVPAGAPDRARVAAAQVEAGGQESDVVSEAGAALVIQGTLALEGTVLPPAPTDVSLWLRPGFSPGGEVTSRHMVRSDAAGAFRLEVEFPGETVTVTARASVEGCIPSGGTVLTVPKGESQGTMEMTFVRRDTVVHGVVLSPGGQPVPGARVLWNKYEALSAEDGTYEIHVAPRFVYRIYAEKSGYGRTAAVASGMEPGSRQRIDFTLTEGFDVHGVVRDESGVALEGARVGSFFRNDSVKTDVEGRFVIPCVSRTDRDSVEIHASLPGFVTWSQRRDVPREGDLKVAVTLHRGVRVTGRTVDSAGEPVAGVEMILGLGRNYHLALGARSDDRGAFAFRDVDPGNQTIWITAEGFADLRHDLVVPEGVDVADDVVLQLDEGRTVSGKVLDQAGLPVEGVGVSMRLSTKGSPRDSYVGGRTKSGADGLFQLDHLPSGDLKAEAYAEGWIRATTPVGDDGPVVLNMRRAGEVRGRVVDGATGVPIEAFRIRSIDPQLRDGESRASGYEAGWVREGMAFEDPNGRWEFRNAELAPGDVLGIEASASGYAPAVQPRAIVQPHGGAEEVVLELWPAVDVAVHVIVEGASRAPAAGALVILCQERHLDEMDRSWSAVTDAEGRALVRGAAPGPLWVKVRASGTEGERETKEQKARTLGPFIVEPQRSLGEAPRIDVVVPSLP